MKHFLIILTSLLFLPVTPSVAKIYKYVDENGRVQFSDKPHPSAKEVKIKSASNKDSTSTGVESVKKNRVTVKHKSLLGSKVLELRSMLKKKEFEGLNNEVAKLEKLYKSNDMSEDSYFTSYEAFDIKNVSLLPLFDAWVRSTPDDYQPYIARAIYFYHLGWYSRGTKWSSETKEDQMKGLADYLNKSLEDLLAAQNLNKSLIVSYYYLMRIATTQGRSDESERLLRKALEIKPSSYVVRAQYLKSLTPRWGGSLKAMKKYLLDVSNDIKKYPELQLLEGYIYNEAGDIQAIVKKYSDSNDLFSKSLEFGEYHETFFKRGKNNNRRGKYLDSLADLNKAIEQNNEKAIYYYWRAVTLIDLKEYEKAMADIQLAVQLDPYDKDIQSKRRWLAAKFKNNAYKSRQAQKPETAVEKYTAAIRLNPNDATMYHGRARAYIQKRNLDSALSDLKKAIEIDPDEINNYSLIDYVLAKSDDWDQIIKYWDKFIKLHPNNGRAYVERGGAYFRKGDIKSAVDNAKISADLGNLEGIEAYDKFKGFVQ